MSSTKLSEEEMNALCIKYTSDSTIHPDDIQIDLTHEGYVSYIECAGALKCKGDPQDSIEKSIKSLIKNLKR